jgi:hypothetical protein
MEVDDFDWCIMNDIIKDFLMRKHSTDLQEAYCQHIILKIFTGKKMQFWRLLQITSQLTLTLLSGEYGELLKMPADGRWDLT